MKKILLLCILLIVALVSKGQITLEHVYDTAATNSDNFKDNGPNQLLMVNFEVSGWHYVKINRCALKISIYKPNHSIWKEISLANCPQSTTIGLRVYDILYLSQHLFDTDDEIEFMYIKNTSGSNAPFFTGIYNEDGNLIFSDSGAAWIKPNYHLQQYPIYNTPFGTKMILSYRKGTARVFGLPGTLSSDIAKANFELVSQGSISNAYPNPAVNYTQIDYSLPNKADEGEIVFYNLNGIEVKRFKVDRTFDVLFVSTSDIPPGTYYYQLQTNLQYSEGKKMVVIK